jgi:hypothetical protein
MAKITLATRNPVFCELMRAFLRPLCDLSVKIRHATKGVGAIDLNRLGGLGEPPLYLCLAYSLGDQTTPSERCGLHQDANDSQADQYNGRS